MAKPSPTQRLQAAWTARPFRQCSDGQTASPLVAAGGIDGSTESTVASAAAAGPDGWTESFRAADVD